MNAVEKKSATVTNHSNNKEVTVKTTKKKSDTAQSLTTAAAASATGTTTAASATDVPSQLQQIELLCGFGDPLPDRDRRTSEKLLQRVPTSIVERILALAARGGGVVAGITLDPAAAKSALAEADVADEIATAAQMLGRRAKDQSIRLRAGVTSNASAIRTALVGYAKTAQGAPLKQENDELRSLAKQELAARKARKTKAANAAKAARDAIDGASGEGASAAEAPIAAPAVTTSVAPKVS